MIKLPFAFRTGVGPMNHVLHEVQMPTWEAAILRGKQANHCIETLHGDLCKDGWTDRGAVWVVDSHGPKASCYMEGPKPPWKGSILVDRGAHCTHSAISCTKTAEPIHLPFRLWTQVGQRMRKFNRIRQVAPMYSHRRTRYRHLSNNIEPSAYGNDAPYYRQHCAKRKALVFNLLKDRFWGFSPHSGDTLRRWGWNFTRRRGPLQSASLCQISPPSVQWLGYRTPKTEIFTQISSKCRAAAAVPLPESP